MANRVPFNALVSPATKAFIERTRKKLEVSEGKLIDIWALLYNVADATGSAEMKEAAGNLLILVRDARNGKKRKGGKGS